MKRKIIIEIDKPLREGELLQYKNDCIVSVDVHELLPDLEKAKKDINTLNAKVTELQQTLADLAKIVKEK